MRMQKINCSVRVCIYSSTANGLERSFHDVHVGAIFHNRNSVYGRCYPYSAKPNRRRRLNDRFKKKLREKTRGVAHLLVSIAL